MTSTSIGRRRALKKLAAASLTVPMVFRQHAKAPPSETLHHASFGANGMAWADIQSLTASKHVQMVAVAEVDISRVAEVKQRFPSVRVYQESPPFFCLWRSSQATSSVTSAHTITIFNSLKPAAVTAKPPRHSLILDR
jgi:hypothetical protein